MNELQRRMRISLYLCHLADVRDARRSDIRGSQPDWQLDLEVFILEAKLDELRRLHDAARNAAASD